MQRKTIRDFYSQSYKRYFVGCSVRRLYDEYHDTSYEYYTSTKGVDGHTLKPCQ